MARGFLTCNSSHNLRSNTGEKKADAVDVFLFLYCSFARFTLDAKIESVLFSCWTVLSRARRWWGHSPGRTRTSRPGPTGWGTVEVHHHCVKKDATNLDVVKSPNWTLSRHRNWGRELDKECLCTWVFWGIWWWTNGLLGQENCSPAAPGREWLGGRATFSTSSPSEEGQKVVGFVWCFFFLNHAKRN